MKRDLKVLFLVKKRGYFGVSYGLLNSCKFISKVLEKIRIKSEVVETTDGNTIDAEVFKHKPTHVFLEAIWVTPEKIEELLNIPRYKDIKWFVRIHSNTPFLAHEGNAFEWLIKYDELSKNYRNLQIASNSKLLTRELQDDLGLETAYTPNMYPISKSSFFDIPKDKNPNILDFGCFGAIRPFKNHLTQALAAVSFANKINKKLRFHINFSRFENQGESILKNLRAIFNHNKHELIEHEWVNHKEFLDIVKKMDLGLQCSFTETFNIVAADFVDNNIPLVGSKEIPWMSKLFEAHPTDSKDIADKIEMAYFGRKINLHYLNKTGLINHNEKSLQVWKVLLYDNIIW